MLTVLISQEDGESIASLLQRSDLDIDDAGQVSQGTYYVF